MKTINKAVALVAIASLAACGGGTTNKVTPTAPSTPAGTTSAGSMFSNMVGVGDSLTAGYQSGGLLGVSYGGNAVSAFPGGGVPAGQYNGFWALLYEQATGTSTTTLANPATSVLPLISPPGIGSQLVPTASGGIADSHSSCDSFNSGAFTLQGGAATRANARASIRDFGVPGITAHEALNMFAPLTTACSAPLFTTDPTAPLVGLLESESVNFYPVLGGFISGSGSEKLLNGQPSSEVNAAASVKPTFATVWLGANDMLHYIESAGTYTGVDVLPGQMQSDITATVQAMQKAGAQGVAVANLPTILETPQFFEGGIPASTQLCATQNWLYCDLIAQLTPPLTTALVDGGDPLTNAEATAEQEAAAYAQAAITNLEGQPQYGFGNDTGWYAMEQGFGIIGTALATDIGNGYTPTNIATNNVSGVNLLINLDGTAGPGEALGQSYVSDALAAKANTLNTSINNQIDAAATATGVALVDIQTVFSQIYQGSGPYFDEAVSINPAPNQSTGLPFTCCTLVFNQGLTSLDGLHPSDTGYALIANVFIAAIDAKYSSANIPPLSAAAINGIYLADPYAHL